MKKLLLFAACLVAFARFGQAQIADGSVAPDFTGTDINGQTYHLYELLDQGKTVILDVSATWCGPCWFYHNTHALKGAWEQWGPNGTNEIVVLFVEGDPNTNLACLYGAAGCSSSTQGNWVQGTPYPIIDDASIAQKYKINYFPTVFGICPNRRVREIGQVAPEEMHTYALNCPVAQGTNNGTLADVQTGLNGDFYCDGGVIHASGNFQNLGNSPMTSATFTLSVDGTPVQTKTWTGNLATFDFGKIQFDPYPFASQDLVSIDLNMDKVNGVDDEYPVDNLQSTVLLPNPSFTDKNRVKFELRTDIQGSETRWEFISPSGKVLYSGGNPLAQPGAHTPNLTGGYAANFFVKDTFILPEPGCFELRIIDDGGDGLLGSGYYKMTALDSTVLFDGGAFGDIRSDWFKAEGIPVASHEALAAKNRLEISPNPASDRAQIRWQNLDFEPTQIALSDLAGRYIKLKTTTPGRTGANSLEINDLPAGSYLVSLQGAGQRVVQKLIVLK